jgi:hypothetical protein
MTEDLTDPNNRVTLDTCPDTPRIKLSYTDNNVLCFTRLKERWIDVLKQAGDAESRSSCNYHRYD